MRTLLLAVFGKDVPVGVITVTRRVIDPLKVAVGVLLLFALANCSGH
jgi:hypothetical protein